MLASFDLKLIAEGCYILPAHLRLDSIDPVDRAANLEIVDIFAFCSPILSGCGICPNPPSATTR